MVSRHFTARSELLPVPERAGYGKANRTGNIPSLGREREGEVGDHTRELSVAKFLPLIYPKVSSRL